MTDSSTRTICLFCSQSSNSDRRQASWHKQERLWAKDRTIRYQSLLTNLPTTIHLSRPNKSQSLCSTAPRNRTTRITKLQQCLPHRPNCRRSRHTMLESSAPVRIISSRTVQVTSHRSTLKSQLSKPVQTCTLRKAITLTSISSNISTSLVVQCLPLSNRLSCLTT